MASCEASASCPQNVGLRRVAQRNDARHRQLVHGDRPRLIRAQDVHRRGIFGGAEPRHQHAAPRQLRRSDGHAHREHHRQGDRNGAHQEDEQERQNLDERRIAHESEHNDHGQQRADDEEQPADDPGDHGFDMQFRPRALDQLRGPPKVGLRSRQNHHAVALAVTDNRPRGQDVGWVLANLLRFAGESRLVYAHRPAEEPDVGRNDVAGADADNVAGDQLVGRNELPGRIPPHAGHDLQAFPQRRHDAGRAPLLRETQHGVDHQQPPYHDEIGVFVEDGRQNHDQFEHPRGQPPELLQEADERMPFVLWHLVVAMFLEPDFDLSPRKARFRIDAEHRQRCGNRRGGNVGDGLQRWARLSAGHVAFTGRRLHRLWCSSRVVSRPQFDSESCPIAL